MKRISCCPCASKFIFSFCICVYRFPSRCFLDFNNQIEKLNGVQCVEKYTIDIVHETGYAAGQFLEKQFCIALSGISSCSQLFDTRCIDRLSCY